MLDTSAHDLFSVFFLSVSVLPDTNLSPSGTKATVETPIIEQRAFRSVLYNYGKLGKLRRDVNDV